MLGGAIAALGAPSAWSLGILDVMDQIANNLLLLGGGLALAIFVGWVMKDPVAEAAAGTHGIRWFFLWRTLLRFAVPVFLLFVLFRSLPATVEAVAGLFGGA